MCKHEQWPTSNTSAGPKNSSTIVRRKTVAANSSPSPLLFNATMPTTRASARRFGSIAASVMAPKAKARFLPIRTSSSTLSCWALTANTSDQIAADTDNSRGIIIYLIYIAI